MIPARKSAWPEMEVPAKYRSSTFEVHVAMHDAEDAAILDIAPDDIHVVHILDMHGADGDEYGVAGDAQFLPTTSPTWMSTSTSPSLWEIQNKIPCEGQY